MPTPTEANPPLCHVVYEVTSAWTTGFQARVKLYNNSGEDIESWTMGWQFVDSEVISNAWDVTLAQTGTQVSGEGKPYNSVVANTSFVQIGFNAARGEGPSQPDDVYFNGWPCSVDFVF